MLELEAAALPDAEADGEVLLEAPPPLTRAVREGSEEKSTVMEAFLQSEFVAAVPVTKFTAAHWTI